MARGVPQPTVGHGTKDQQTVILAIETSHLQEEIDQARLPELAAGADAGTILLTVRAAEEHTVESGALEAFVLDQQKRLKSVADRLAMNTTLRQVKPRSLEINAAHGIAVDDAHAFLLLAEKHGFTFTVKAEKMDMLTAEEGLELALKQPHTRVA